MNPDFLDMLRALCEAQARFLIVGAHALAAHGIPRATGDLDIWVLCDRANAERVYQAIAQFGAPLGELTIEDLSTPGTVFQIGIVPCRVDLLTQISGVDFNAAWARRLEIELEGLRVGVIGREDLIANKKAAGRAKDLLDVQLLERK